MRQVPTLPYIFLHFCSSVQPLSPSLPVCGGILIELLTVILLLWPGLCLLILKTCVMQKEKQELQGKKAILLRCLMFICENSGLSHWMSL